MEYTIIAILIAVIIGAAFFYALKNAGNDSLRIESLSLENSKKQSSLLVVREAEISKLNITFL